MYLPPKNMINKDHMKQVLAGHKKLIKLENLVPCTVPRLNEFRVDILYQQAMADPVASRYLPDSNG